MDTEKLTERISSTAVRINELKKELDTEQERLRQYIAELQGARPADSDGTIGDQIITTLAAAPEKTMTVGKLLETLGGNHGTVRTALNRLKKDKKIYSPKRAEYAVK